MNTQQPPYFYSDMNYQQAAKFNDPNVKIDSQENTLYLRDGESVHEYLIKEVELAEGLPNFLEIHPVGTKAAEAVDYKSGSNEQKKRMKYMRFVIMEHTVERHYDMAAIFAELKNDY